MLTQDLSCIEHKPPHEDSGLHGSDWALLVVLCPRPVSAMQITHDLLFIPAFAKTAEHPALTLVAPPNISAQQDQATVETQASQARLVSH